MRFPSTPPKQNRPRSALTNLSVERLKPRNGVRVEVGDAACPGLCLRITPAGVRTWSVIYRIVGRGAPGRNGRPRKGAQKRYTIGPVGAFSLAQAREQALNIIRMASLGQDPIEARFGATKFTPLDQLIEDFAARDRTKTAEQRKRQLQLHCASRWKGRSAESISRADVHKLLDDLSAQQSVDTSRRARKHLSALFGFALDRGIISQNPVAQLKRSDLQYVPRDRTLSDDELRAVWNAAIDLGYAFGPLVQLLALTGARLEEIGAAHRSNLDVAQRVLVIPAAQFKSRRQHAIPFSDAAWAIIEGLPYWGEDTYLLSTTAGRTHVKGYSAAKRRLDKTLHETEPFVLHDLRRTVKTGLAALGVPKEVRDACLGHQREGMDRVYNWHDYRDEVRAAMNKWAERVQSIAS